MSVGVQNISNMREQTCMLLFIWLIFPHPNFPYGKTHTSVKALQHTVTVCYINILLGLCHCVCFQVRTGVQCWRSLCPGPTSSPLTPLRVSEWWACPQLWPTLETSPTGWELDRLDIQQYYSFRTWFKNALSEYRCYLLTLVFWSEEGIIFIRTLLQ